MRRVIFAVVIVAAVATGAKAGSLDAPLSQLRIPRTLPPCGIATAVAQLARAAHILIGFERTSDCRGASSFPRLDTTADAIDLGGASVREALDKLITLVPSYRWAEIDAVAVIRPVVSWADPTVPLNFPVSAFTLSDGTVSQAVANIVRVPVNASPLDGQRFSLSFEGGTIADALSAVVRAHGGAMWDAGVILNPSPTGQNADSLMVTIRTFNAGEKRAGQGGFTVATPVARLRATAVQ